MYQLKPLGKTDFSTRASQLSMVQPKLTIGRPGDKYEQEADAVADRVMKSENYSMQMQPEEEEEEIQMKPMTQGLIQMKCKKCVEEEMLQTKAGKNSGVEYHNISNQIQTAGGSGNPLSAPAIQLMNNAFGADFNDVKVHNNSQAHELNQQLGSRAFTYGTDIFFNKGEYNPESRRGKHLLAHELTHTLQQGKGLEKKVQKYSHEDCDETTDLRPHIWPADHLAKDMVNRSIAALSSSPVTAATNALLDRHFRDHSASTVTSVLSVFQSIKDAFDDDDYTYECEDDCKSPTAAYVYGIWSDIHLCMNELRGKPNRDVAGIIVHEFSHYYGGTDDEAYYFFYVHNGAPTTLSTSDAIDNADSYGGFAYEI